MDIITRNTDRFKRLFWLILAISLRPFIKVKKGKIFCWAYYYKQYSCNPKYITEYLLDKMQDKYEVVWAFNRDINTDDLNKRIKIVRTNTFAYLKELYSSQFVITNSRSGVYTTFFLKKKGQKYIQTWHGSIPLKKIEKDAEKSLTSAYIRMAKHDSNMCDLIISNSDFFSGIIKKSFWWKSGEILKTGVPRNDLFFKKKTISRIKNTDIIKNSIFSETEVILYAPTFRDNYSLEPYRLNWKDILNEFESLMNKPVKLFLRLHPNLLGNVDIKSLLNDDRIIDMSGYQDMQELLAISDILITDYSSSMFDFSLTNKPCFLYAPDHKDYNRGFYFNILNLPFPFADTEESLINNVKGFSSDDYLHDLEEFKKQLGIIEDGHATQRVFEWIEKNTVGSYK